MGSGLADGPADAGPFVTAQVVEDDDIAGCQCGHQELFDPGGEACPVDRAIQHHWSHDAVVPEPCQEGECLPVPVRHLVDQRRAARRPAARARHVGLGPGLVDEDQTGGIELMLMGLPAIPQPGCLRSILLACQQCFFWS